MDVPFARNTKTQRDNIELIVHLLKEDSRMKYKEISERTGIPSSTVFDLVFYIKKRYHFTIIEKEQPAYVAIEQKKPIRGRPVQNKTWKFQESSTVKHNPGCACTMCWGNKG